MRKAIFILLSVLFAVSCTWEPQEQERREGEGEYLSFVLKNESHSEIEDSRSTPATRAVDGDDAYNENFIDFNGTDRKDLHIFFFDQNETDCIFFPEAGRLSLQEGTDSRKVIRIQLTAGDGFTDFDPQLLVGETPVMYVVANSGLDRSAFMDGATVKPLADIMGTVISADFNQVSGTTIVKQTKFVMDAKSSIYVSGATNVATMTLKRVASKIQLGIYNAMATGYKAVSAEMKLVNFVDRAALGKQPNLDEFYTPVDADYSETDYIPLVMPAGTGVPSDATYSEPLYSYPSNWASDMDKEAYLLLKVMWEEDVATPPAATAYYYKIPISYIPSDVENGAAFRYKLRRNYIYRYYATLTTLGSPDPENPAELGANLDIMSWGGDNQIDVTILKFDWLFVDQQNIVLYPSGNLSEQVRYLIPYRSSSNISFTTDGGVTAQYQKYNPSTYVTETKYYGSTDQPEQIPTVNLAYTESGRKYIEVLSLTPANYVPKEINFKVENTMHLFATVKVTHYPPIYATGTPSNRPPQSNKNSNVYTITTLALTGTENFNWGWTSNTALRQKQYTVGTAFTKNANGTFTFVDASENAWVVSPKFMVQSALTTYTGGFGTMGRNDAISRCNNFEENGLTGWRLPSLAELYLIDKLQNEGNSAIKDALKSAFGAQRAWSAGTYLLTGGNVSRGAVYNMNSGSRTAEGAIWPYIHVPICVRDVYQ